MRGQRRSVGQGRSFLRTLMLLSALLIAGFCPVEARCQLFAAQPTEFVPFWAAPTLFPLTASWIDTTAMENDLTIHRQIPQPPPCDPSVLQDEFHQFTGPVGVPCPSTPKPYEQRFLNTGEGLPMTPGQKGHLAIHNLIEPGNLVTIVGISAFTVGINAHTAYGPGIKGFGKDVGVSYMQDATGQFFGTWLIPSLTHEDPHYHRLPQATIPRRFLHAISRTAIAQHDNGGDMPNYATLLTYPICAEIGNLYVPGIRTNGPSTVARIMTGYATDPVDNLITEFLPDVARRIHARIIFVQRILNQVTSEQY